VKNTRLDLTTAPRVSNTFRSACQWSLRGSTLLFQSSIFLKDAKRFPLVSWASNMAYGGVLQSHKTIHDFSTHYSFSKDPFPASNQFLKESFQNLIPPKTHPRRKRQIHTPDQISHLTSALLLLGTKRRTRQKSNKNPCTFLPTKYYFSYYYLFSTSFPLSSWSTCISALHVISVNPPDPCLH